MVESAHFEGTKENVTSAYVHIIYSWTQKCERQQTKVLKGLKNTVGYDELPAQNFGSERNSGTGICILDQRNASFLINRGGETHPLSQGGDDGSGEGGEGLSQVSTNGCGQQVASVGADSCGQAGLCCALELIHGGKGPDLSGADSWAGHTAGALFFLHIWCTDVTRCFNLIMTQFVQFFSHQQV